MSCILRTAPFTGLDYAQNGIGSAEAAGVWRSRVLP